MTEESLEEIEVEQKKKECCVCFVVVVTECFFNHNYSDVFVFYFIFCHAISVFLSLLCDLLRSQQRHTEKDSMLQCSAIFQFEIAFKSVWFSQDICVSRT